MRRLYGYINSKKIVFLLFILLFATNVFASVDIVIFHTNDMHSRVVESKTAIGYAKISGYIEQVKSKNKNVLILDAGDTFHGTLFAGLTKGESIVEILNELKLNAMSPGNHDFDYGFTRLQELNKKAKFLVLSANVSDKQLKSPFQANQIFNIGGIKIGVFGLTTPETAYKTHPKNVENILFLDPVKTAREQVDILKSKGANIIIAINHLGIDESTSPTSRSTAIATVEGVDIIIDGHSHTVIDGLMVENSLLVQTGALGANLGQITITVNDDKSFVIKSTLLKKDDFANVEANPKILKIIDNINKKQAKQINQKVANIPYNLEVKNDTNTVRTTQFELGQLVANSMQNDLNADFAVVNGGGLREPINKGDVLYSNILTTLPFAGIPTLLELKGSDLLEMLEFSVQHMPTAFGGFLHVSSNISFTVNTSAKAMKRLSNVTIKGEVVDKNKLYKVVVLDFMASGGDGYKMLMGKKTLATGSSLIDEVFANYLKTIDWKTYKYQNTVIVK